MGFSVLKFGGSSVADATNMSRVLDIVGGALDGGRVVLVSSAISGCTDGLLACADGDREREAELMDRHLAIVRRLFTGAEQAEASAEVMRLFAAMEAAPAEEKVTFGELLSTRILARKLECERIHAHWVDSRELVVKDDLPETYRRIRAAVAATDAAVVVAPGFICCDSYGRICTLGRGGSDYSAALYAAALGADSLQIWTDVPGIMTANPKQVPAARTIPGMSYRAALEMAEHGAKVLYAPTVAPAMEAGIDIEIRNTFAPAGRFTRISSQPDASPWIGVASQGGEICLVGTEEADFDSASDSVQETLRTAGIAPLEVRVDGLNLLVRVREAIELPALQALHRAFFETRPLREVNLFIAGFGAVGKALVQMVGRTAATVAERTGKTLRVAGLGDSRRWRIDLGGVASLDGAVAGPVQALPGPVPGGPPYRFLQPPLLRRPVRRIRCPAGRSPRKRLLLPLRDHGRRGAPDAGIPRHRREQLRRDPVHRSGRLLHPESDPQRLRGRPHVRVARQGGAGSRAHRARPAPGPRRPRRAPQAPHPRPRGRALAQAQRDALAKGCRRRFVAFLEKIPAEETVISTKAERPRGEISPLGYRAGIRVEEVRATHPAYYLRGTENAILIRSAFHPTPIVIQGPGEGARQAAASLLNDILR